jgi:preprotein translocase subunit SecA
VEGRNFDIRKQLLEYDDVANDQRKVVYEERNQLMDVDDISDNIKVIRGNVVNEVIDQYVPPQSLEELWDVPGLEEAIEREFGVRLPVGQWLQSEHDLDEQALRERVAAEIDKGYEEKVAQVGPEVMRHFEKAVMLQILDGQWKDHLASMDHLRQGIGLRGYAQKNPKQEYKAEAFNMFSEMLDRIKREVIGILARVQIQRQEDVEAMEAQRERPRNVQYEHPDAAQPTAAEGVNGIPEGATAPSQPAEVKPFVRQGRKVGRNEPCPCGSGKKYKQCHGKLG